jgi:hypothetical protein
LSYADESGNIIFEDPATHENGPSAGLVDKDAYLKMLSQNKLVPVWVIAGEKGAYGEHHDDFVGRRIHSYIYTVDDNQHISCISKFVRHERGRK